MKITNVRLGKISVPLRTPFKTALRTVCSVEDVVVEIHTDCGRIGYGEAPPTGPITGDTIGAIIGAIQDHSILQILQSDELDALVDQLESGSIVVKDIAVTVDLDGQDGDDFLLQLSQLFSDIALVVALDPNDVVIVEVISGLFRLFLRC